MGGVLYAFGDVVHTRIDLYFTGREDMRLHLPRSKKITPNPCVYNVPIANCQLAVIGQGSYPACKLKSIPQE